MGELADFTPTRDPSLSFDWPERFGGGVFDFGGDEDRTGLLDFALIRLITGGLPALGVPKFVRFTGGCSFRKSPPSRLRRYFSNSSVGMRVRETFAYFLPKMSKIFLVSRMLQRL